MGIRYIQIILFVILSAASVSCSREKSFNRDNGSPAPGLQAVLYPDSDSFRSSREARVNVVIVNDGNNDATVNMWNLGQPMIALDVINEENGERMPTIEPATPDTPENMQRYLKVMKPKEKIEISYTLHIFSPELPRGRYLVRLRSIPSNRVLIIIR